jgi:uncharacterized protein YggE
VRTAVEDALRRARAMAAGAGVALGPIERITEEGSGSMPPPMPMTMRMAATEAANTPVAPGDIEIRTEVLVMVRIRQ